MKNYLKIKNFYYAQQNNEEKTIQELYSKRN